MGMLVRDLVVVCVDVWEGIVSVRDEFRFMV